MAKLDLAKGPKQGTKQLQGGFLEPGQRLATQPNRPIAFLKQFYHITTCYNRVFSQQLSVLGKLIGFEDSGHRFTMALSLAESQGARQASSEQWWWH